MARRQGSFKGQCATDGCGEDFALWSHKGSGNYYCKKCAGIFNRDRTQTHDNLPICWPVYTTWTLFPQRDGRHLEESRIDQDSYKRRVTKMVSVGPTEWMIYFDTVFEKDQYETAAVFHDWMRRMDADQ